MNFLFPIVATIALIAAPAAFFLFFSREKLKEEVIRLGMRKEAIDQRLQEQRQEFGQMQEHLKLEFRQTATSIFDDISKKFSTQSEKQMGDILNPLRERLNEFKKQVEEAFGNQAKEQFSLKNEIQRIVLTSDNLSKALRGDAKAQGNWGEIMLERILEASGLRAGEDYIVQGAGLGIKGAEGNSLRPDIIVNLPDKKHIIVDSKVSLNAYERYGSEENTAAKENHLKDFLRSIKKHTDDLSGKSYHSADALGTPDFVLLFMPTEGAFSLAVQHSPEMLNYAWENKIMIVSPSTLFASLRTIASLWRIENQNQNARIIAEESGKFYDKLVGFTKDMLAVGSQIEKLQYTYGEARKKLSDGKGNLVRRAEKLKELGAKTTLALPEELLQEDEEETASLKIASDNAA